MFTQTHATSPLNSYVIGYIDDDPFFLGQMVYTWRLLTFCGI